MAPGISLEILFFQPVEKYVHAVRHQYRDHGDCGVSHPLEELFERGIGHERDYRPREVFIVRDRLPHHFGGLPEVGHQVYRAVLKHEETQPHHEK